jgi:hypothetical protein
MKGKSKHPVKSAENVKEQSKQNIKRKIQLFFLTQSSRQSSQAVVRCYVAEIENNERNHKRKGGRANSRFRGAVDML